MSKKSVHVKWHVPSTEELEWAKKIFLGVFTNFSEKYDKIGELTERNEALNKSLLKDLQVLACAMDGVHSLLPFWDTTQLQS
jgi:hypothetical protein